MEPRWERWDDFSDKLLLVLAVFFSLLPFLVSQAYNRPDPIPAVSGVRSVAIQTLWPLQYTSLGFSLGAVLVNKRAPAMYPGDEAWMRKVKATSFRLQTASILFDYLFAACAIFVETPSSVLLSRGYVMIGVVLLLSFCITFGLLVEDVIYNDYYDDQLYDLLLSRN